MNDLRSLYNSYRQTNQKTVSAGSNFKRSAGHSSRLARRDAKYCFPQSRITENGHKIADTRGDSVYQKSQAPTASHTEETHTGSIEQESGSSRTGRS
jgi:hypothetical protein